MTDDILADIRAMKSAAGALFDELSACLAGVSRKDFDSPVVRAFIKDRRSLSSVLSPEMRGKRLDTKLAEISDSATDILHNLIDLHLSHADWLMAHGHLASLYKTTLSGTEIFHDRLEHILGKNLPVPPDGEVEQLLNMLNAMVTFMKNRGLFSCNDDIADKQMGTTDALADLLNVRQIFFAATKGAPHPFSEAPLEPYLSPSGARSRHAEMSAMISRAYLNLAHNTLRRTDLHLCWILNLHMLESRDPEEKQVITDAMTKLFQQAKIELNVAQSEISRACEYERDSIRILESMTSHPEPHAHQRSPS